MQPQCALIPLLVVLALCAAAGAQQRPGKAARVLVVVWSRGVDTQRFRQNADVRRILNQGVLWRAMTDASPDGLERAARVITGLQVRTGSPQDQRPTVFQRLRKARSWPGSRTWLITSLDRPPAWLAVSRSPAGTTSGGARAVHVKPLFDSRFLKGLPAPPPPAPADLLDSLRRIDVARPGTRPPAAEILRRELLEGLRDSAAARLPGDVDALAVRAGGALLARLDAGLVVVLAGEPVRPREAPIAMKRALEALDAVWRRLVAQPPGSALLIVAGPQPTAGAPRGRKAPGSLLIATGAGILEKKTIGARVKLEDTCATILGLLGVREHPSGTRPLRRGLRR